jgi:hypothetical protein
MKLTTILKALIASILLVSFVSCDKAPEQTVENVDSEVSIMLDVDKVSLESVNVRVRHNGEADMLWVYMVTPDMDTPADVLIDEKLASDLELTDEIVAWTGQNKSVQLSGLSRKAYYRFICKALDSVTGKPVGVASELVFRTRRDPSVFEVNDNWTVTVGDRVVDNISKMEYDNFVCTSSDDESYILLPIRVTDFEFYYQNNMRALFEDYVSDFGLAEGDSKWKNIVKTGDNTLSEERLRSGEWLVFMIGIDSDGELTGYYQKLELKIEQETATDEYTRWLGKWQISDKNGNAMFQIEIIPSENNMWYYMSGWESNNVYGYDTTDPALMPELFFDKETGEVCFISQYVNTLINGSDTYDFFFSGTFTYGSTFVLGSEVLNYRMADAVFIDSTYNKAMIQAGTFSTQGMTFPIESICYMYSISGQLGAISLAPPTLPLNMTKVN